MQRRVLSYGKGVSFFLFSSAASRKRRHRECVFARTFRSGMGKRAKRIGVFRGRPKRNEERKVEDSKKRDYLVLSERHGREFCSECSVGYCIGSLAR